MLTQVSIRNYKSIANVEVDLGPLTVLVGPNGSGKSSFVDALRFIKDVSEYDFRRAIREQRGQDAVFRMTSEGFCDAMSVRLKFELEEEGGRITAKMLNKDDGFYECTWNTEYDVPENEHPQTDRSISTFKNMVECLRDAGYYNILPDMLRTPQKSVSPQDLKLSRNADNLSSVLVKLRDEFPDWFERLVESLSAVVPDLVDIEIQQAGSFHIVSLKHQQGEQTITHDLSLESDGTLRLLGLLAALYQQPPLSLMTFEEPELMIHPDRLGALYEIIKEASLRGQIIITTHSPEFIWYCDPGELRVVEKVDGATQIAPLDQRQVEVINDRIFSTSDLLRIEGLQRQPSNQV